MKLMHQAAGVSSSMNFLDDKLPLRFWSKCTPEPNSGCWLWFGGTNGDRGGYGKLGWGGRRVFAHRLAYSMLIGAIPNGMQLDHRVCKTPYCVNPAHLEVVTSAINTERGRNPEVTRQRHAAVTHCPRGHEYTADNTDWFSTGAGYLARHCRACVRARAREYQRRRSKEIA